MRTWLAVISLVACVACEKQLHGTGTVYLYNGTNSGVTVELAGRSQLKERLRTNSGRMVEEVVAGDYQLSIAKGDEMPVLVATAIVKDRLTIVNVDSAGCFVRADVSGMYNKKKAPVRLLQQYEGELVISIPEEIAIPPGQRMPERRPKNVYAFQRVAVIPCDIEDDWMIEDYLQKHK